MEDSKNESYGLEIAQKIVEYLKAGGQVANRHRDYCGMGLWYENGTFYYGEVNDGFVGSSNDHRFATEQEFVTWLSSQTDKSMDGGNDPDPFKRYNQRITRKGLLSYIKWFEKNKRKE